MEAISPKIHTLRTMPKTIAIEIYTISIGFTGPSSFEP